MDEQEIARQIRSHMQKFSDPDEKIRWNAHAKVVEIGEPAVHLLVEAMDNENPKTRGMAAVTLGEMQCKEDEVVLALIRKLNDPDIEVRKNVCWAFIQIKDPRAIQSLIDRLSDENQKVREMAIEALGKIGDKRVVPVLVGLLENAEREQIGNIANALGEIGNKRATDVLLRKLIIEEHGRKEIIMEVAYALGYIKDEKAVDPLIEALENKELHSRNLAAVGLGMIGDKRAVDPLIKVIKESCDTDKLFGASIVALGVIGDPKPLPLLIGMITTHKEHQFKCVCGSIKDICKKTTEQGKVVDLVAIKKKLDAIVNWESWRGKEKYNEAKTRAIIVYEAITSSVRKARNTMDNGVLSSGKPKAPKNRKTSLIRVRRAN